jgi:hypothetical protein
MNNKNLKKSIILGVIFLFIGTSFTPIINADTSSDKDENNLPNDILWTIGPGKVADPCTQYNTFLNENDNSSKLDNNTRSKTVGGIGGAPNSCGDIQNPSNKDPVNLNTDYNYSVYGNYGETTNGSNQRTNVEIFSLNYNETIHVLENGEAHTDISINVPPSSFTEMYRDMLGAPSDVRIGETIDIPESMNVVRENKTIVSSGREAYYKSIMNEGWYFSGVKTEIVDSSMTPKSVKNECLVNLETNSWMQVNYAKDDLWKIAIGPSATNDIANVTEYISSVVGYSKLMLNSITGNQLFKRVWTTTIELPSKAELQNMDSINGKTWIVDFGCGTYLNAYITIETPTCVKINEVFVVSENTTVYPTPLGDYKSFELCYQLENSPPVYSDEKTQMLEFGSRDLWTGCILDFPVNFHQSISWGGNNSITGTIDCDASFSVLAGVSLGEAWIQPTFSVDGSFELEFTHSFLEYKKNLTIYQSPYWTFVVPLGIPIVFTVDGKVQLRFKFEITGSVTLTVPFHIEQSWIKAGIRYSLFEGIKPIWEPHFGAAYFDQPTLSTTITIRITPSLAFPISFKAYGVVGPVITPELYLEALLQRKLGEQQVTYYIKFGFDIKVGVTIGIPFIGDITWDWTIVDFEIWKYPPEFGGFDNLGSLDDDPPVSTLILNPMVNGWVGKTTYFWFNVTDMGTVPVGIKESYTRLDGFTNWIPFNYTNTTFLLNWYIPNDYQGYYYYTLSYLSKDNLDNTETQNHATEYMDAVLPSSNINVNEGQTITAYETPVTITGSDATTGYTLWYKVGYGTTWSPWMNGGSNASVTFYLTHLGTNTIEFYAEDGVWNKNSHIVRTVTVNPPNDQYYTFSTEGQSDLSEYDDGTTGDVWFTLSPSNTYSWVYGEFSSSDPTSQHGVAVKLYDSSAEQWIMVGTQQVPAGDSRWHIFSDTIPNIHAGWLLIDTNEDAVTKIRNGLLSYAGPSQPTLDYSIMCDWAGPNCGDHGPAKTEFNYGNECWSYSEISNTAQGDVVTWEWIKDGDVRHTEQWTIPQPWSSICCWDPWTPDERGFWQVDIKYNGVYLGSGPQFSVGPVWLGEALTCEWINGWRDHGPMVTEFNPGTKVHVYLEWAPTSHNFNRDHIGFKWYHNGELVWKENALVWGDIYNMYWSRFLDQLPPGQGYIEMYWNGTYGTYLGQTNTYTVLQPPILSISPTSLNFSTHIQGWTNSSNFEIWNSGTGTLSYTINESIPWISVSCTSGNSTGEHDPIIVNVVNTSSMLGHYEGNISITSNGGTGTVNVSITIETPNHNFFVNPTDAYLSAKRTETNISSTTIYNNGNVDLYWGIRNKTVDWITGFDPFGGVPLPPGDHVTVSIQVTAPWNLGTYDGQFTVYANGCSDVKVYVHLTVVRLFSLAEVQTTMADTPNDINHNFDSIQVDYTLKTSMPYDQTMVKAYLYANAQDGHPLYPLLFRYEQTRNYNLTPAGITDSITISLSKNAPQGTYTLKVYAFNSTGIIDRETYENNHKILRQDELGIYAKDSYIRRNLSMAPPDDQAPTPNINGPTSQKKAGEVLTFYANSADPNADKIEYQWDWRANKLVQEYSLWQEPFTSGVNQAMKHKWTFTGPIQVRVRARDIYHSPTFSNWSAPWNLTLSAGCEIIAPAMALVGQDVPFSIAFYGVIEPVQQVTWDFGGGKGSVPGQSHTLNPVYNYAEAGSYTPLLTVKDALGNDFSCSKSIQILRVIANFSMNQSGAHPNKNIKFTDKSVVCSGSYIDQWTWNFGDQAPLVYTRNATHSYTATGDYNVTLTVREHQHGDTHTRWQMIHIDTKAPDILYSAYSPYFLAPGANVALYADFFDNHSGIKQVNISITTPNNTTANHTMSTSDASGYDYEYRYENTWQPGQYNYTIWATDRAGNINRSRAFCFIISTTSPVDGSQSVSTDPYLTVHIDDPNEDVANVSYYQYYPNSFIIDTETQWKQGTFSNTRTDGSGHVILSNDTSIYGDGHNGTRTYSSYHEMHCDESYIDLTINSNVIFNTMGHVLKVSGTLINHGTITDSSTGGSGGNGGPGGLGQDPLGGHPNPDTGNAGYAGTFRGGHGGAGGAGGGGALASAIPSAWADVDANGGNGGNGGKGGHGGGEVKIYAFKLNNQGSIHADGGNGDDGNDGAIGTYEDWNWKRYWYSSASDYVWRDLAGGGGGGGDGGNGGDGGYVNITYSSLINLNDTGIHANRGNKGNSGGGGDNYQCHYGNYESYDWYWYNGGDGYGPDSIGDGGQGEYRNGYSSGDGNAGQEGSNGETGYVTKICRKYVTSGTYYSKIFDAGTVVGWVNPIITMTMPAKTNVTIAYGENTTSPTHLWTYYPDISFVPDCRWLRLRVNLTTTNVSVTPSVDTIKVSTRQLLHTSTNVSDGANATYQWTGRTLDTTYYWETRVFNTISSAYGPVWDFKTIPPTCFLAGTKVTMADGTTKNIEDIKVGDIVKSYDTVNKVSKGKTVAKVYHHTPQEMTEYYLVINKNLKVTPNHPLFINGVWKKSGDAKVGDSLFGVSNSNIPIKSVEKVYERVDTYNFDIVPVNPSEIVMDTYYVQGVLVRTKTAI